MTTDLLQAGFSEQEIAEYENRQKLSEAGFSRHEIESHFTSTDTKPSPIGQTFLKRCEKRQGVWGINQQLDGLFSGENDITDLLPTDVSYDFGKIVGITVKPEQTDESDNQKDILSAYEYFKNSIVNIIGKIIGISVKPEQTKDKMSNSLYYSVEFDLPLDMAYRMENSISSLLFGKGTTPTTARGRIANRYKAGKTSVKSMDLGYEVLKETWQDRDKYEEQLKNFEKLQGQVPEDVRKEFRGFWEKTAGATAEQIPILWESMKVGGPAALGGGFIGGMIAGIGSVAVPTIGEEPIAIGAGMKIGASVAAGLFAADRIRQLEAGGMFLELAEMKDEFGNRIDPKVAVVASHAVGAINGGIEVGKWGVLLSTFGIAPEAFKAAVGKVTKKLLGDKAIKSIVAGSIARYGIALGAETLQEIEQESTNILFGELAKELNNQRKGTDFKPITAEDLKNRYSEVTTESLRAFGIILAPGVGISGAIEAIKTKSDMKIEQVKVIREKDKIVLEVKAPEGKESVVEEISPGVELRQKAETEGAGIAQEATKETEATITPAETKKTATEDTEITKKTPWEMTREEFAPSLIDRVQEITKETEELAKSYGAMGAELVNPKQMGKVAKRIEKLADEKKNITNKAWVDKEHRKITQKAVKQGKPVPREVLEEYKSEKWAKEALEKGKGQEEKASAELNKLREKAKNLARLPGSLTEAQEKELDRIETRIDKLNAPKPPKRLISKEAYEKAKKRITDTGTMRMGIDPQGFLDMATIGAYHLESGIYDFAKWSKKMIEEFGDKVRPHLQKLWKDSNRIADADKAPDKEKQKILDELEKKWEKEWMDQFDKYDDVVLGVPDDIHHEELTFPEDEKKPAPVKPKEKKSFGLTRSEADILGPEFSGLARWAQAHDEPIGYKKGVADRAASAKEAIDRLRMASNIRKQHRIDAANLVYTFVPRQYRGDFLKRAIAIRTPLNAERFAEAIELWVNEYEFREAVRKIKKLKKTVEAETKYGETKYGRLPPGLREKVKSLLDYDMAKMTEKKEKRLKSRKEWINRVAAVVKGGLTEMPSDMEEKFADEYKDFTVINQNLIDEMHRLEQDNIHSISIDQINRAVEQVEKLLDEHSKKGKSRFRRRFENWHKKKVAAVNEIFEKGLVEKLAGVIGWTRDAATVDQYNIRTIVGFATGLQNDNMMNLLFDALVEGKHERARLYKESVEAWQKEVKKAKITTGGIKALEELVTVTIGGKDLELTRDDLLTIYGYTIADGTLKRLLTTEGLNILTIRLKGIKGALGMTSQEYRVDTPTVQELRAISDVVLPAHKKLLDIHFKIAREYGAPNINKTSIEVQNTEIADTRADARYLAVHREFGNRFSGEKMSETAKAVEMMGRFQPRSGGKQRMNIRSFTQEVMAGLQANALYSAMTIPMMEARSLLASKDYTDKMQKYGHRRALENLSSLYNRMLAYGTDAATMDLVFGQFFSQAGKSILSLRITGAAIQTASISAAYGVIDRRHFSFIMPTIAEITKLMVKYPFLWLRWKARQFDYVLGTLTAARGFKTMIMETTDLTDKFLNHYTWGDMFAIYNIYKAAERMTAEMYKVGSKEYENALLKTFERAMETQPMWDTLHRSKLTTDSGFFAKGFTMFMSARAAQFNVIAQAINDYQRKRISQAEMYKRIGNIAQAALTVSVIRQIIRKGIQIAGIGFLVALGLRDTPDEEELTGIAKDLAVKLPTETLFNMTGLNVVGSVLNAAVTGGMRASKFKWGAYDARNLRTGNFGVDLFVDMVTTGIEGVEFMTDLLTLKKSKDTRYKKGEYAFYDSGERFIRDVLVLASYRLGLPLMGPVSDLYYPLKRAYEGSKSKKTGKKTIR